MIILRKKGTHSLQTFSSVICEGKKCNSEFYPTWNTKEVQEYASPTYKAQLAHVRQAMQITAEVECINGSTLNSKGKFSPIQL